MMNSTRKMKNNTCAMLDAVAAMPPNPKMPATMATTRKINAQYNIVDLRPKSRTTSALRAMARGLLSERMPQAESSLRHPVFGLPRGLLFGCLPDGRRKFRLAVAIAQRDRRLARDNPERQAFLQIEPHLVGGVAEIADGKVLSHRQLEISSAD